MYIDNPIRNSNCHELAVKNKMDTGRREHFSVSHITSLLANIQLHGWLKGIYVRLKISVYSRQRVYIQIKNRYVILI